MKNRGRRRRGVLLLLTVADGDTSGFFVSPSVLYMKGDA